MDAELLEDMDSHVPTEEPTEDFPTESNDDDQELGARTVTWTLTCFDAKVHPKTYQRLKSEIAWSEEKDDCMTFKSTVMSEIDIFSKQLKTIFAENEEYNTVREFSFTITSRPR